MVDLAINGIMVHNCIDARTPVVDATGYVETMQGAIIEQFIDFGYVIRP